MKAFVTFLLLLSAFSLNARAQAEGHTYKVTNVAENDHLKIRSGPGMNFPVVAQLSNGSGGIKISGDPVINGTDDWISISHPGGKGWTRPKYLKVTAQENAPANPHPPITITEIRLRPQTPAPEEPANAITTDDGEFAIKHPRHWTISESSMYDFTIYSGTLDYAKSKFGFSEVEFEEGKENVSAYVEFEAKRTLQIINDDPTKRPLTKEIRKEKITGKVYSGLFIPFELAGGTLKTDFVVSDGKRVLSGWFSGTKDRWEEVLTILKNIDNSRK